MVCSPLVAVDQAKSVGHRRDRSLDAIHQRVEVLATLLANCVEATGGLFGEGLAPAAGAVTYTPLR